MSAVKFAAVVKFMDQVMKDFKFSVHGMLYLRGDVEGELYDEDEDDVEGGAEEEKLGT